MNVAIIGSRGIKAFDLTPFVPSSATTIISGGARGIDCIARNFAISNNIPLVEFLPEYDKYARSAPIIRNKKIVNAADLVLAIWDGKSKGTAFTIEFAKKQNKKVVIVSP